jgi:amino acid adenylation domain-containing protein
MLAHHFLEHAADRSPDKTALVCGSRRLTYAEIDDMANRLARGLMTLGLARGDRVVVHLDNSVEAVVSIFAAMKAGCVCVPLPARTKPLRLAYVLNNCQAAALITSVRTDVAPLWAGTPSLRVTVVAGSERPSNEHAPSPALTFDAIQNSYGAERVPERSIALDLACLIYTSGSTGQPKGVMCDHGNVTFVAHSIMRYLRSASSDVVIGVLPVSFDYGLYQVFMTFGCGGTLVLEQSFAYPAEVLMHIEQERVTGLPGVPSFFAMLLAMDLSPYDLASLRYITNTAASLPASHILALRKRFPNAELFSMYGLTETKRTLYLPPDQLDRRPDSVGIAIPGTEVWVEDTDGKRLGPGEVGELVVRGPHVMRGYWRAPQDTAQRFRPGPLPGERVCHTGDLFKMDDEGYMYFVGRTDDIFKSRGHKVAPKEIEQVLYDIPGVIEAGVVPVADAVLGHAIKAFVAVDGRPLTQAQVLAHCRAHLEDYLVPKYVEFRVQLPKTATGKIDRRHLALGGNG